MSLIKYNKYSQYFILVALLVSIGIIGSSIYYRLQIFGSEATTQFKNSLKTKDIKYIQYSAGIIFNDSCSIGLDDGKTISVDCYDIECGNSFNSCLHVSAMKYWIRGHSFIYYPKQNKLLFFTNKTELSKEEFLYGIEYSINQIEKKYLEKEESKIRKQESQEKISKSWKK